MKFSKNVLSLSLAAAIVLFGCKSDKQLTVDASKFVASLGSNYVVAKSVSKQAGYSVILNTSNGKYFAVNLNGWKAGSDAGAYLDSQTQKGSVYYNLTDIGGGDYKDYESGLIFESDERMVKDGQSAQGFVDRLNYSNTVRVLSEEGFPNAQRLAQLTVATARKGKEMSDQDFNALLESVAGITLDQLRNANDQAAQRKLIEAAATHNRMTPEAMQHALTDLGIVQ